MSRARDLFFSVSGIVLNDATALGVLREAAAEWRSMGRYFSAGYGSSNAIHAAWGTPDVNNVIAQAVEDYKNSFNTEPPDSLEGVLDTLRDRPHRL